MIVDTNESKQGEVMKLFGNVSNFAMAYKIYSINDIYLEVYVDNRPICKFIRNNKLYDFIWDIREIIGWIDENFYNILSEEEFPLPVIGETGVCLYENSGEFDSLDDNEFDSWYEIRYDWVCRHSWFSSRKGGYLADIYFRKVGNKIELSWDNRNLFDNVRFINPIGLKYVEKKYFENIIERLIISFKNDIRK